MSSALENGQSTIKHGQTSGMNHRTNHFSNSSKQQPPQKSNTVGYIPTEQDLNYNQQLMQINEAQKRLPVNEKKEKNERLTHALVNRPIGRSVNYASNQNYHLLKE